MRHTDRLTQFISYNPETGRFHWIKDKARAKAGDEVGWIDDIGYRRTQFDGKTLWLHVIAWEMYHGPVPFGFEVDHRDGDRANNALSNLRIATRSQNMHNTHRRSNNTTGVKGVNWNKEVGKFQVQLMLNRKKIHGGYFSSIEAATQVVRALRERIHGEFARHE